MVFDWFKRAQTPANPQPAAPEAPPESATPPVPAEVAPEPEPVAFPTVPAD
ncbi:MAG: hypothetical protein RLZZ459_837, partial [Cyanobacteriota bacterium]